MGGFVGLCVFVGKWVFWEELGKGSRGRYGVRQAVADESREQCEEGEGVGAQKST
jgi:hypothetical protein